MQDELVRRLCAAVAQASALVTVRRNDAGESVADVFVLTGVDADPLRADEIAVALIAAAVPLYRESQTSPDRQGTEPGAGDPLPAPGCLPTENPARDDSSDGATTNTESESTSG